jgi:hypothetical protein
VIEAGATRRVHVVEKPGDVETFARRNERVRIARIHEDAKLPMAERLDQGIRLSKFATEFAEAGRRAREMTGPNPVLRRLAEAGVSHIIIGGFAVAFHGVVRATQAVDICPAPDRPNLERLATALRSVHAKQANAGDCGPSEFDPTNPDDLAQGGNFQLETDLGRLDIMQWLSGIDADHAFDVLERAALAVDWHDLTLRVCSLEHLRAMKRAAGRPRDLQDLADLEVANS